MYTVRFGCFWRGFTHHTYRVWFHPMLNRTSLLEDKTRSTQGAVNFSSSVLFVQLYHGSLKIWDREGNTTNCSTGLGFGRNIMWLFGWEQKRKEKWLGESLRFWDGEGKTNFCSAGLGFGREMKVADDWVLTSESERQECETLRLERSRSLKSES